MTKISNLYSLTNYITANTSGNIVISAPSSGYALDVTGTGRFTSTLTTNTIVTSNPLAINLNYAGSVNDIQLGAGTPMRIVNQAYNSVLFYLNNAGNVGIGTSSPAQKLDVYGRTRITNASNSAQFLEIYTDGGSVYYNAQNNSIQNTAYQHIFFTDGASPVERMRITSNGNIGMPTTYGFTTSNAANLYIDSGGGLLYRSTSSLKYKTNVRDYDKGLDILSQMRPVYYEGIGASDSGKVFAGLIAEEIHDLGLTEFVQYAEDGTPDALAYQNMVSLLIKGIQELSAKVTALENK